MSVSLNHKVDQSPPLILFPLSLQFNKSKLVIILGVFEVPSGSFGKEKSLEKNIPMKKTIIFDLGGVLIEWDRRTLFKKIFTDGNELDYFLTEVCSPEWNSQLDLGVSFEKAVQERILDFPDYAPQIQAYFERWEEMITGSIPGTVKILEELKEAGYPLAVLSNWSAETFPKVRDRFEFLSWFNPLVISGEVGLIKPEPEIYQHLLQELGTSAENCIFIDDSLPNIEIAEELGFKVIAFTSSKELRTRLEQLNILTN